MLRAKRDGFGRSPRRTTVLLIGVGLAAYFGYHTLEGRHGLKARYRLIERSKVLDREIEALEAVRSRLQREVGLLDLDRPDLDYVDELAREMLGFAHPNDKLIVLKPSLEPSAK